MSGQSESKDRSALLNTKKQSWYVYIAKCRDGTLYTGSTNRLESRIQDHNRGKGGRYTKYRRPMKLLYVQGFEDRSSAMKREAQIKGWRRSKKIMLIEGRIT